MPSVFLTVDSSRHDGDTHYAMSSTLAQALEVAKDVWENKTIYGELMIWEYEIDIYPNVVVRIYNHTGQRTGQDIDGIA